MILVLAMGKVGKLDGISIHSNSLNSDNRINITIGFGNDREACRDLYNELARVYDLERSKDIK